MRIFVLAFAFGLLCFMPFSAKAQIENYTFDKVHTQIEFSVSHLGFSHPRGRFLDFDGGFVFNRGQPEKSRAHVVIKTASIEMHNEKWNAHLRSPDFFNVEKFPEMTFDSTGIEVTGDNAARITGNFTLLGVTKPIVLDVVFNKAGKHAFSGQYVAGFSAQATIKRSDFGMTFGLPLVGDTIKIYIEAEGLREDKARGGVGNR